MLLLEQGILLLPIPPQAFPRTWCLLLWSDRSDLMEATSCGAEVLREATRAWGWGKKPYECYLGWAGTAATTMVGRRLVMGGIRGNW